jgi:hypothetical protein
MIRKPKWTLVVVPSSRGFCFPSLCPGCLRLEPNAQMRVRSEKSRLQGFYLVATKWENLYVTVPCCGDCAKRRRRWEKFDATLLVITAIAALALALWIAVWLDVPPWAFWAIFLGVAAAIKVVCDWLVSDFRAVRIRRYDNDTTTFAFSRTEYAREFARFNSVAQ